MDLFTECLKSVFGDIEKIKEKVTLEYYQRVMMDFIYGLDLPLRLQYMFIYEGQKLLLERVHERQEQLAG